MKEKIIVNIKNLSEITEYEKQGITNFLVPLANFCVGYDELDLEDINRVTNDFYLLINRLLPYEDLVKLKEIFKQIDNRFLKGIFFEDLGVLSIINELNLNLEKIYFANHFGTNYASINAFLERNIDSMVISNEITKEEIKEILNKTHKDLVIPVYGYNQIMYSRRNLISNFNQEFALNLPLENKITEKVTKKTLRIKENKYGTVIYDEKIYNNLELLEFKNNIKFYYINTSFLTTQDIFEALNKTEKSDFNGFLDKKTIYKIGDINE